MDYKKAKYYVYQNNHSSFSGIGTITKIYKTPSGKYKINNSYHFFYTDDVIFKTKKEAHIYIIKELIREIYNHINQIYIEENNDKI